MTSPYPERVLSRSAPLRAGVLVTLAALVATLGPAAPVSALHGEPSPSAVSAKPAKDPRKRLGLFVDPLMPAYKRGGVYREELGGKSQALWITPEHYGTPWVRDIVRGYTSRALKANKTPILTVYGIPDRDCQQHSSGGLADAAAYRAWIRQIARGVKRQRSLLVLEPDALPFIGDPRCQDPGDRLGMLSFASRTLSKAGAWVYIDSGHSDWRPYDNRPELLKRAGIRYARGFSTNVSNFRTTASEHAYAREMLSGLRDLGVKGKRYIIDTSRNGAPDPVGGDVYNPYWARVGKSPRLVFKGPFDGSLWIKHPGESDGPVNGGGPSGAWCDNLAKRLLGRPETGSC
jgi:endoglucanase